MLPSTSDFSLWELTSSTSWAFMALFVFLSAFYWYNTRYRGLWEKYNIPVPPAWPIINHYPKFKEGEEAPLDEWFKTYGDTFGTYGIFPHQALLVTKDLKLLKHILVKDFGNFMNRHIIKKTWTSLRDSMFFVRNKRWTRIRHSSSPIFTGQKLRVMMTHVTKSAKKLEELIALYSKNNELVPVKFLCGKYASEVIARVGFGLDAHAISKEESEFGYNTNRMQRHNTPIQRLVDTLSFIFPPLYSIAGDIGLKVDLFHEDADAYFIDILKKEIKRRRTVMSETGKPAKPRDMVDMYLETEVPEGDPRLQNDDEKVLTEDEIISNLNLMILAAFETVSSTLQTLMYELALHQDIQDKIVEEVGALIPEKDDITFDNIQYLTYTEQVIHEALRIQPPLSPIFRQALETKTYEGWTIPAGAKIMIPLSKIMMDPAHWGDDPQKYDPDRFSPENRRNLDPMAFMPFGWGPRVCIGQRFAMMELKGVLATLLRKFRFELSERSEPKKGEPLKLIRVEIGFTRPVKPVMLEVRPRN